MKPILILVAATAWVLAPVAASAQPSATRGEALFNAKGCYECHGTVGQGSFSTGPSLAPHTIPKVAFEQEVRRPRAVMPPYTPKVLSDAELDDIYAYLSAIPPAKSPDQIPLLNSGGQQAPIR